jgi:hypothetical protein
LQTVLSVYEPGTARLSPLTRLSAGHKLCGVVGHVQLACHDVCVLRQLLWRLRHLLCLLNCLAYVLFLCLSVHLALPLPDCVLTWPSLVSRLAAAFAAVC